MRRLRTLVLVAVPVLALLAFADPAYAHTYGGEGLYGPTDDVAITNTMFLLIGLFPAIIIVFSILQGFSDRRKHHKIAEQKAAAAANPDRGGW